MDRLPFDLRTDLRPEEMFYLGRESHFDPVEARVEILRESTYHINGSRSGKRYMPPGTSCIHELFDVHGTQYLIFTSGCASGELVVGKARLQKGNTIDYLFELLGV